VAVVTGAARGLGRAYALKLAKLGADVGIIDIDLKSYEQFEGEFIGEQYETVVDELKELGVKAFGAEADISKKDQVQEAFSEITKHLGEVDILVANAGGGTGPLEGNKASEIKPNELQIVLERNLFGTIHSVEAVAAGMKKKGSGKIVTVTSVTGLQAQPGG